MRRRYAVRLLIVVVIVAAGGWVLAWERLADGLRDRIAGWAEGRRAEGLTVEYDQIRINGFPLKWHVTIVHPHLAGAGPTGWSWVGEAVEADVIPWSGRDVPLRFPGDHRFAAGRGDVAEAWTVNADRPLGRAGLDNRGRLDQLNLDFTDVTVVRATTGQTARAGHLNGHAELHRGEPDHEKDTFDLALALDNVQLSRAPAAVLGPQIAHAEGDLAFKARLPAGNLASSVSVWRDDGGTVEINRLALKWGPVDADGSGTLALDADNRLPRPSPPPRPPSNSPP